MESREQSAAPRRRAGLAAVGRAARDLGLIVAGVLLALAADSWWDNRQERRAEAVLFSAMAAELKADLGALRSSLAAQRSAEASIVILQDHLAGRTPYSSDLDSIFGKVYGTGGVTLPATGAYEGLKSRGFDVVADDVLRIKIIHLYENVLAEIRLANEINYNVNFEVLRPYYLANFREVRPSGSATPLDYDAVMSDPYFANLLVYRLDVIRRSLLPRYEDAVQKAATLLVLLEVTLGTSDP
jgi:hypothetical protein